MVIAVVSWNTRDHLKACLQSLGNCDPVPGEVWVLDNGSTDGSTTMVQEEFPAVRLLVAESNIGYGNGVNRIAQQTESEWIIAANADVIVEAEAIERLLQIGRDRQQAAILSPQLVRPTGDREPSAYRFPSVWAETLAATGLGSLSSALGDWLFHCRTAKASRPMRVDYAKGAFLAIRREVFFRIGGFNESQWMYAEDLDLCWRARRDGWETLLVPASNVVHAGGASTTQAFGAADGTVEVMTAYYAWLRSRRPVAGRVIAAIRQASLLLRTAVYAARGLAGGDGSQAAARVRDWRRTNRQAWSKAGVAHSE